MYWNDFKNYLQEYPSDFPDAQAYEALLQIANDNTGRPMTEYTHYNLPVSFAGSQCRSAIYLSVVRKFHRRRFQVG